MWQEENYDYTADILLKSAYKGLTSADLTANPAFVYAPSLQGKRERKIKKPTGSRERHENNLTITIRERDWTGKYFFFAC